MDVRFSRFEIVTGTGALFLCLVFVCVFLEARVIENDLGTGAARAIADHGLFWAAIEPSGQHLVLTGAAGDERTRQRAGEAARAVSGVTGVSNRIDVVGAAGSCQRQVNEHFRRHPVAFKAGRADLTESSLPGLTGAAAIVRRCGGRFEIAGHTDASGDPAINLQLSQRRAEVVMRHLVESGADPARLTAVGYGQRQPIADNRTAAGRSANQRLEMRLKGVDA
jgi:outer membrane protein OmpA-like peptidoglycan-associated protein